MRSSKQTRRDARHLLRLCSTSRGVDEDRARQLLQRVLREKPRGYLPVLANFQRLVRLDSARRTATVETATPLSPDVSAGIRTRLETAYGPGLNLSFVHTPSLVGGMCITVGSDVYDSSVRARLAALAERL